MKQYELSDKEQKHLTRSVQKDLLFHIVLGLKRGVITKNYASKISKDFLSLHPFVSADDVIEKLSTLIKHYPEINDVYVKYASIHYKNAAARALFQTSHHLKNNQIHEAIAILKSVRGGER